MHAKQEVVGEEHAIGEVHAELEIWEEHDEPSDELKAMRMRGKGDNKSDELIVGRDMMLRQKPTSIIKRTLY